MRGQANVLNFFTIVVQQTKRASTCNHDWVGAQLVEFSRQESVEGP